MCLYTLEKKPQTARKNITCYKVIQKNMRSLFCFEFVWEFGKVHETTMDTVKGEAVEKAFHSFCSLEDTAREYSHSNKPCMVVECTIPKGAQYYSGSQPRGEGYASNKLIVNRVVDIKEVFPNFDFDNFPYKVGQETCIDNKKGIIENIQPHYRQRNVYVLTNIPVPRSLAYYDFVVSWDGKLVVLELFPK